MFQAHFRRSTGLLAIVIAVAGCGGSKRGTVPLDGTVKLDGRPLEGATVHFIAQDSGSRDALGTTDAEGLFRLSTFEPNDGAFPGKYKVVVRPPIEADPAPVTNSPADAMGASEGQTASRPSVMIPERYSDPGQTILVQNVPASGDVVFELKSK